MKQEYNISDAEMVIMRVIWSLEKAKVDDVMRQIAKRQDWSLATVKTLLGRLTKKKFLLPEKEGRAFVYQAAVNEAEVIDFMAKEMMEKVCETKHLSVISNHIRRAKLTKSDLQMLINQLSETESIEEIDCSCLDNKCHCVHSK